MVRDTVRELVTTRVMPTIGKHCPAGTFPHELVPVFGEMGLLGPSLTGYGCAGITPDRLRPDLPGARARRLGHPLVLLGAGLARDVSDLGVRLRGAEAELAARDGGGPDDRLLRPDRARLRLEPAGMLTTATRDRAAATGSTAPSAGSPTARSRRSRSCGPSSTARSAASSSRPSTQGLHRARHPRQVVAARERDERADPRGLRGRRGRAAARRERHARPAVVPVPGALRHLLRRGRRGDGLLRRGAVVREGPRAVLRGRSPATSSCSRSSSTWSPRSPRRSCCACGSAGSRRPSKLTPGADLARQAQQRLDRARHRPRCARHPRRQRRHRRVPVRPPHAEPRDGLHLRGHARHPHAGRRPGHHRPRGVRRMTRDEPVSRRRRTARARRARSARGSIRRAAPGFIADVRVVRAARRPPGRRGHRADGPEHDRRDRARTRSIRSVVRDQLDVPADRRRGPRGQDRDDRHARRSRRRSRHALAADRAPRWCGIRSLCAVARRRRRSLDGLLGDALRALGPHLTLITPNARELGVAHRRSLSTTLDDAIAAARALATQLDDARCWSRAATSAATTSIDVLRRSRAASRRCAAPRIAGGEDVHGTGCALSSAIAAYLAHGRAAASRRAALAKQLRRRADRGAGPSRPRRRGGGVTPRHAWPVSARLPPRPRAAQDA